MATPQDLTTTVSGRRCTRSRARTAASSTLTSTEAAAPTELTSTTTTQEAAQTQTQAQTQTTTAEAPPPSSSTTTEAAQQAPPPDPTSSTIGTSSAVLPLTQASALANANVAPSAPVAAAPGAAEDIDTTQADVSVAALPTEAPTQTSTQARVGAIPATSSAATSDTIPAAVTSDTAPSSTLASVTSTQSSVPALPDQSASSEAPPQSSATDLPEQSQNQPDVLQPSETGIPPGGEAGITAPDQGTVEQGGSLTLANDGQTNVASIAGGVVGGFVALAVISALLFLCLRRRKTGTFERWQRKMSEKESGEGGIKTKFKAVSEKLKAIPAGFGIFFAKIKGNKAGPNSNPYRRHTVRSSVSSIYSTGSQGRTPSISESPGKFRQQLRGFGDRMPSLKRSRTLLQKKPDSFVTGAKSPFPGIVDDPVRRNSNGPEDPFQDPEPPKMFLLTNPDPPTPRADGLQDQQRGPLTPKPTAISERSKDPFASIMDELEKRNGSGTPEWLRDAAQAHKRTASTTTALRSHPPSNYTASIYTQAENPFFDPSDAPPVPTQPLPPNPPPRTANAYGPLPSFNATSSTISRDSDMSFYLGEPGPTRPGTNMYGSRVRQSDPFDLDRPEVLSFGAVNGKGVRASVTRQNSRARRSNVPNWVNVNEGPYKRDNVGAVPSRNASARR
jgi:hypothetical protein